MTIQTSTTRNEFVPSASDELNPIAEPSNREPKTCHFPGCDQPVVQRRQGPGAPSLFCEPPPRQPRKPTPTATPR
ncbi:hypothetical protein [Nocardia terpenica]|uniref:hypothetical protein n=1 Tax=Nocardia terpenica TaxID=455432 RepID=UPI0012FE4687|nr:hypothetical protein [Nocardia terpenica]